MGNVLDNLPITTWYKALVVVSAAALIVTLGTQRDALALISAGAFLFGLGEWQSHKRFIEFGYIAGHLAKRNDTERKTNWLGVLLQFLGVILILYGIYRAFGFTLPQLR